MEKHWTEKMFIDAAPFFSADLELRIERAREEVKSILTIFKEFEVPSNGLILDLCCGIGRHSVALAEEGYEVVGVDISPYFIDRAKEYSESRNVGHLCDFIVGDMRQIAEVLNSHGERFDAVINTNVEGWNTHCRDRSKGCDDQTDEAVSGCRPRRRTGPNRGIAFQHKYFQDG